MNERPVAIDLFAGCGGMSLGLEAAGFNVAVAVEFDAVHALVHHFNFPYCHTICRDITQVTSKEIIDILMSKDHNKEVDLITGGPPCQGFSLMGKRQIDDPRNSLVFEYFRIISEIKPKYFIFENVPGIATGNHRQFLEELITKFESIGYTITQPVQILDASEYGAPQKRKRLILNGNLSTTTTMGNTVGQNRRLSLTLGFASTAIPEPSSTLSLLALGILGAALTLKRKL